MTDDRTDHLTEAQTIGLQGYYDAAFEILEDLLSKNSADIAALRLKGNLLELKAMELLEINRKKFTTSADYLAARQCYERILGLDPENVRAHIDLGDHYGNLDANDKALKYYKEAARLLQKAPQDEAWKEDVEELGNAVALLTKHDRLVAEANSLKVWCNQALRATASTGAVGQENAQ
jgi:tetratricopeptide (TPR) repeat protein